MKEFNQKNNMHFLLIITLSFVALIIGATVSYVCGNNSGGRSLFLLSFILSYWIYKNIGKIKKKTLKSKKQS